MGLSATLVIALAWGSALGVGKVDVDWARVWSALRAGRTGTLEVDEVRASMTGLPEGVRARVARHHLATLEGGAPAGVPCQSLPQLAPGGAWAFALSLEAGPALDEAIIEALAECPDEALPPLAARGYAEFMAHTEGFRGSAAVPLALALHLRSRAVWSGQNLAIAQTRAGQYDRARQVLAQLLEGACSEADRRNMENRLALVWWGESGLVGARLALGGGLVRGRRDSYTVLGLGALERAQPGRARALFRSALHRDPAGPWARRGWGLSMVPLP